MALTGVKPGKIGSDATEGTEAAGNRNEEQPKQGEPSKAARTRKGKDIGPSVNLDNYRFTSALVIEALVSVKEPSSTLRFVILFRTLTEILGDEKARVIGEPCKSAVLLVE